MHHKNAAHWHLQWSSSCRLLHQVAVPSSAVSAISNPCWKGAFILFFLWDSHVMSTRSVGVKALTCRHLQCYSYCRLVNLLHHITVLLPLIFVAVASSDSCWKGDKSHKSDLGAVRRHFTNCSAYASKFCWCHIFKCCLFYFFINVVAQRRLPGSYRANTSFSH